MTKDKEIPFKGQKLYRIWNDEVGYIVVYDYNIDKGSGATAPTVVYLEGNKKVRVSADMYYASLNEAWKNERLEAKEALMNIHRRLADLVEDQSEAYESLEIAESHIREDNY